jgi:hypothetical protein
MRAALIRPPEKMDVDPGNRRRHGRFLAIARLASESTGERGQAQTPQWIAAAWFAIGDESALPMGDLYGMGHVVAPEARGAIRGPLLKHLTGSRISASRFAG